MMDSIQDQENRDEGSIISVAEGLNLASGFFFIANALLTEVLKTKNDFPALYDVIGAFHTRLLEMCDGQQQDLCAKELSLEGYLDMLRKKSGAFFSLACYIGARMACGRPDWWKRFSDFGSHLGVVIQILDDLEDWYKLQELQNNAQSVLPKMDWYKNLPAVYALEVLPSKERRDFRRAIDKVGKETSAVSDYIGWVNRSGAALFILALIGREVGYAKEALSEEALVAQPKEDLIRILELLVGKLGACSNDPTQRAQ
ncbi:MAG: polyprenyl synthetase family protein [Anaerolineales bacterium]|nr:polyprenyl synthetase family protein [Anaerolineales bacterium]MDW8162331.1 polyprenyl synthetase family protein [Anaerolineales bacterium]